MSSMYSESIYFDAKHKDLVLEAFSLIHEELQTNHRSSTWDLIEWEGKVKITVEYEMPWLSHQENYAIVSLVSEVCEAFIRGYLIAKGISKQEIKACFNNNSTI